MKLAYLLSALSFIAGIGLNVTSGWLITMASTMPPVLTLSVAVVLVRFFGISRAVTRYIERYVSHKSVFNKLSHLRSDLYQRIISNPRDLIAAGSGGRLIKQVVDDVERAEEYELRVQLPGVAAVISMFAATLLAFWLQPLIGLLWLALTLILNFLIPVLTMKTLLEKAATIEKLESKYADQVRTSVHGALEAEIYGYLDEVISEVHKAESEILKAELKLVSRIRTFQFLINLLIGSGLIATVLYASNNQMPAVQVAMLVFLALTGFEANLAWYPNLFNSGKLKLAEQNLEAIPLYSVSKGEEVAFDKLSLHNFSGYWTNPTAKPLTFEIQRGEVLVLRGASGVGKSTTAMALAGLTDYQGSAQISGTEIRDISNLSDLISGALQNGHIFNTSLRENLKISGSENFEEILELLELKQLVSELPNGLDTIIGQYGRALSGGEAKRVVLARALLSKAPLLILDEPTEHLDPELAERITQRILERFNDRAILVITHSGWSGVPQLQLERITQED
jgi:thiol reductant ABC exporter CydC subunit